MLTDQEWQEKKGKWRAVLLSLPCCFNEMSQQEQWRAAFNKRQNVLQEHESLSRTALQSACEVAHLKALVEAQDSARGKLSAQALSAELLRLGLQQVVGGTGIKGEDDCENGSLSATFLSQALNVHKNVVSQSKCVELLMDLEAKYGTRSPFHSMSKLNILSQKPSSNKTREWVLACVYDMVTNNVIRCSDVTRGMLQGDRTHCGLVSLCETKLKARRMGKWNQVKLKRFYLLGVIG